jgi:hypothetical protein
MRYERANDSERSLSSLPESRPAQESELESEAVETGGVLVAGPPFSASSIHPHLSKAL